MIIIDGRAIARKIEELIIEEIKKRQMSLSLASLFVGEAADSALYTKRKAEAAERLNIDFTVEHLPQDASVKMVEEKIHELNERAGLDGYIVQLPLPAKLRSDTDHLINLIDPQRDVDGLTETSRSYLLKHEHGAFLPTPVGAVMTILASLYPATRWEEQLQFKTGKLPRLAPAALHGEQATIISDGDVFGPSLKLILENGGMQASVQRSDSASLAHSLKQSKLVITAVGKPKFLTGDMIKDGAIIIDVGTTLVNGKTVGDVDWESVSKKATAATPVPGGVGPVTVAMLFANLFCFGLKIHS